MANTRLHSTGDCADSTGMERTSGSGSQSGPARLAARPSLATTAATASRWVDRLAAHFIRIGKEPDGAECVAASADAVLNVLDQAVEQGQWQLALELARVAEPAFQLTARWGAWARTLELALRAARAVGDRSIEGWVLHEQGVREMALGRLDQARDKLGGALQARTDAGDEEQAELTRSQLAHLTPSN